MAVVSKRALVLDQIEVNEELGPRPFTPTPLFVKTYLYATDSYRDWYLNATALGDAIVPPAALGWPCGAVMWETYDGKTDRGIMSTFSMESFAPVRIGQTMTIHSHFTAKFVKRGEPYYVLETTMSDQQGALAVRFSTMEMCNMRPGFPLAGGNGTAPDPMDLVDTSTSPTSHQIGTLVDATVGSQLPVVEYSLSYRQILAYAGPESNDQLANMHVDDSFANSIGLPAPIVPGILIAGYLNEYITDVAGASWVTGGQFKIQFLQPTYPDYTLTLNGAVREIGDTAVNIDCWARNQTGKLVFVAKATAPRSG